MNCVICQAPAERKAWWHGYTKNATAFHGWGALAMCDPCIERLTAEQHHRFGGSVTSISGEPLAWEQALYDTLLASVRELWNDEMEAKAWRDSAQGAYPNKLPWCGTNREYLEMLEYGRET